MPSPRHLSSSITWLVATIISFGVAVPPAAFFALSYFHRAGILESHAQEAADNIISAADGRDPSALFSRPLGLSDDLWPRSYHGYEESRRVLNARGVAIYEATRSLAPPLLTRSAPLIALGAPAGRVEIRASLRGILLQALLLLVGLSVVGAGFFLLLWILPIRSLHGAEKNLRESEEKFRSLAEWSPNMILILRGHRIHYANRICAETTGYAVEELCSPQFRFSALVSPPQGDLFLDNFRRRASGEVIQPWEQAFLTKGGREITVIIATRRIAYEGEDSVLAILTDITDRKGAEQAIQLAKEELEKQNLELKKLDRMKDGLIRDVSHELKSPVAKLSMQMDILRQSSREELAEKMTDALRIMEGAVRRQEKVINNILSIYRLEAGHRKYSRSTFPMEGLLREVMEDFRPDIELHSIRMVVDLDPVFVFSDREMLWHVFSNILGNAIKFRNTGSPAVIVVSLERSGTHALVEIIDNGIGLDAAETERVFDKFFRAAPTYEGSGVGLSLAKKIVEDLNGMIAISSRGRGKGATVSVSLPAASPDEAERDVPAP